MFFFLPPFNRVYSKKNECFFLGAHHFFLVVLCVQRGKQEALKILFHGKFGGKLHQVYGYPLQ